MSQLTDRKDDEINVGYSERVVSTIAGAMMLAHTLNRKSALGKALSLGTGMFLMRRGLTGHCGLYEALNISRVGHRGRGGIAVDRSVSVNRPREEVYRAWRRLESEPFTTRGGQPLPGARSLWEENLVWRSKVMTETENELVVWRSSDEAPARGHGSVSFEEAPGGSGTEVHVRFIYDPPAGSAAAALGRLTGTSPGKQIDKDLRNFKQVVETGEISTVEGQSSGRRGQVSQQREQRDQDCAPTGSRGLASGQFSSHRPPSDRSTESAEAMRSHGESEEPPVTLPREPEDLDRHYTKEHDL